MDEKEPEVRVMSKSERNDYDGVTIDENTGREEEKPGQQERIIFRTLGWKDLILGRTSWTTRIAIALVLVALAALFVFVIGPILLVLAGVAIAVWFVMRLFFY